MKMLSRNLMLKSLIEKTPPEWQDKFLSYKDMKKQLKLIYSNKDVHSEDFAKLLDKEIDKFNNFLAEKEEDYIINMKVLKDRVDVINGSSCDHQELMRDMLDLHGEMVLLANYSALNFTGLAKILKKYNRRTGALIHSPFLRKVLDEPPFCTHTLNKLVKECETMLSCYDSVVMPRLNSRME